MAPPPHPPGRPGTPRQLSPPQVKHSNSKYLFEEIGEGKLAPQ